MEQLKAAYQWANNNSNYIVGGLVVIVLVLVIGWVVRGRQLQAEQAAWNKYNDLQKTENITEADIDQADALIQEFKDDRNLGPVVMGLKADLLYERAMDMSPLEKQDRRVELLKQARQASEQLIRNYSKQTLVVAQSRMRLAAIEETLYLAGESDKEKIRKIYQQLTEAEASPYAAIAEELLNSLDDRLADMKLVTTQPADTQPATATQPAIGPQPDIELVPTQ
jgi:hypothetical protein